MTLEERNEHYTMNIISTCYDLLSYFWLHSLSWTCDLMIIGLVWWAAECCAYEALLLIFFCLVASHHRSWPTSSRKPAVYQKGCGRVLSSWGPERLSCSYAGECFILSERFIRDNAVMFKHIYVGVTDNAMGEAFSTICLTWMMFQPFIPLWNTIASYLIHSFNNRLVPSSIPPSLILSSSLPIIP